MIINLYYKQISDFAEQGTAILQKINWFFLRSGQNVAERKNDIRIYK